MIASPFWNRLFGVAPWRPDWQRELSEILERSQRGLPANMVVVVARESDLYAELLFLFCFVGMAMGQITGYLLRGYLLENSDLLYFPLAGFILGSALFSLRHFYISRFFGRLVRARVSQRAKALFFEHEQKLRSPIVLLYFSELERDALILGSPGLLMPVPGAAMAQLLNQLVHGYKPAQPLGALKPCLQELGALLRLHLPAGGDANTSAHFGVISQLGLPSDRTDSYVHVIKGNKDIN